jgi:hypothetical protein
MKDKFGLRPLKKDSKQAYRLGWVFDLPKLIDLPLEFEIPPFEVIDQKGNDFCAAASVAGQNMIMNKKRVFYPALFAISKTLSKDLKAWGQDLHTMERAALISVPLWEDMPDYIIEKYVEQDWDYLRDINNYPEDMIEKGKKNANGSFFKVWHPKYDDYDTARAALWKFRDKEQTIVFGVIFSWLLDEEFLKGTKLEGFGHAMLKNGFSVTEEGLIITNSYGKSAGKNGQHILARETINFFAKKFGMYMAVDMPKEEAKIKNSRAEWHYAWYLKKILLLIIRLWK